MNPQKNIPDINQVYISPRCNLHNFSVRQMNGYNYMQNGIMRNSGLVYINRYAQDFKIHNNDMCVMLLTFDNDEKKIEKFIRESVKQLKKDDNVKAILQSGVKLPQKVGIGYEQK